jgi:hypothetical protein
LTEGDKQFSGILESLFEPVEWSNQRMSLFPTDQNLHYPKHFPPSTYPPSVHIVFISCKFNLIRRKISVKGLVISKKQSTFVPMKKNTTMKRVYIHPFHHDNGQ